MIDQSTLRFHDQHMPWMSSHGQAIDEEVERTQSDSHSLQEKDGDDEKIDIESQRPPSGSEMASSGKPPRVPSTQKETEASSTTSSTFNNITCDPVIINMDLPSTAKASDGDEEISIVQPAPHLDRHPRDSWDYRANDNFEIEKEVVISEVEQEVAVHQAVEQQQLHQQQDFLALPSPTVEPAVEPFLLPPSTGSSNELRSKLHNLSDLILPSTADELQEPESEPGPNDNGDGLEISSNDAVPGDVLVPISRRKPPRPGAYRAKTRLQDPPPTLPAVTDQIANLRSDAGTRSRRNSVPQMQVGEELDGGQYGRFGPTMSRRVSMIHQPLSEEDPNSQSRAATSRKSSLIGGEPIASAVPTTTPSRLGLFSPSRLGLFSPSRVGLLSKSKANLVPAVEEEHDPLDDDAIPTYKRMKKKQRKWLVVVQWLSLAVLVLLLIFAVRFNALQAVVWRGIALWQWLSLAIVVVSGRLISGWCVLVLVALIERHYILKKRVLYFIYGLRHAVKNCIWLALVIGVWKLVFKNIDDQTHSTPIITKVLWCLFTTSCLWMLKILAVKVAANSFHRAAYFDRVQDCLFHQYVLETLSAPRLDEPHWTDSNLRSNISSPRAAEQQAAKPKFPDPSRPGLPVVQSIRSPTAGEDKPNQPKINLARAPSRTFLGASPKGSRQNLRSSASRMDLGGPAPQAVPSQLQSPRNRRVSITVEPGPMMARSSVPIGQDKLQELTSETVSAWTLKRLMKMIRKTNIATFSSILEQEVGEAIDSEAQAKSAAKQIFYNIARPGEKFLSLSDFLYFMPEEQATRAFGLFELNDAGHITKKSLMKWVVNVYKERRALALTLSDNRTVVAKLHRVLDVLLFGIAVTIWFLIMGVNTQQLLVAFSSVLLPSVFVFGNAARSTFESLIFLFVMHPFDVGDRISIDGQAMIVEEMNILNTILLSGSNEKVYYPNSILATKAISNYYRSPDQWDAIEFQIHSGTPVEQLGLLKERMTMYIEGLPQFWYPVFRIVCKDIEDSTRMKMALWVQHHLNYQESGERWQRRSNMILHMKTQLEELGIGFHLPRQEITVTGVPVLDVPPPRHATPM